MVFRHGLPKGKLVGWKKALRLHKRGSSDFGKCLLVQLEISARAHATKGDGGGGKCRASSAKVLRIETLAGKKWRRHALSWHRPRLKYVVGKRVKPNGFDKTSFPCAHGIHFFLSKSGARRYNWM